MLFKIASNKSNETTHESPMVILQWNAQSMNAHGTEFYTKIIENKSRSDIPDIICIQESWFSDYHTLEIPDYISVIKNRRNSGRGGLVIYIHKSITFQEMETPLTEEYQRIDIFSLKKDCFINKFL